MDGVGGPRPRHPGLNLHDDSPFVQEHAETSIFGFWVFLMSDAVVFALLFAIYGTMLTATAGAPGAAQEFKIGPAFAETMILLTSSFTFAMASLAMKYDWRRRGVSFWLAVTLALGIAFLGFELHDFSTMFASGATPERSGFLSAFFVLVGMHGLHVTSGVVWLSIMLLQLALFGLDDHVKINVLRLGLFWHFLDVVWVVIFSVVYLQGILR